MTPRYSLLHATYRRGESPVEVKDAWLSAAADPAAIEHIFALDADDSRTLAWVEGHRQVVSPPTGEVTAVRNWNAAAAAATGDVLVVIADDLYPPPHWDVRLAGIIGPRLDPVRVPFAVKALDVTSAQNPATDTLMRHPIVSRAFYEKFGLFSPRFTGVYCDNDITRRALWGAVVLDGRSGLVLEHRHATTTHRRTESTSRINEARAWAEGLATYEDAWTLRQRAAPVRLVRTDAVPLTPMVLRLARLWFATLAALEYARSALWRHPR
ncbi:Glycosyl transferase family 2 [Raineyella antarctica]|uniref:Glycosyl transferase family 2 n=1 Tax=Raineyella antarctica TaxID=1577474 RepID=A0A1G6GFK8_9ACTN|nr:glycosyltransferase [Raineyella antarctica]SDB80679.1 Glycosyl transferase family 2 [Raineyella antarctica]